MDSGWCRNHFAQSSSDLNGEQLAMLIAMLDGLGQADVCRHHQPRTTPLARAAWSTIGVFEDGCIAPPAIAAPGQRTALRACHNKRHCLRDEIVADASGGTGSDETAGAVLHKAQYCSNT